MRYTLLISLLLASVCCFGESVGDSVSIYFNTGSEQLTGKAKTAIDSLVQQAVFATAEHLRIVGHADPIGDERANHTLSQMRAIVVGDYLMSKGIRREVIDIVEGKSARRSKDTSRYYFDRRVDVIVGNHVPDMTIDLNKIPKNGVVRLDDLLFRTGSTTLLPASNPTLDMLYKALSDNPKLKLSIEGHVCCPEPSTRAMKNEEDRAQAAQAHDKLGEMISTGRARAVYDDLVKRGIASNRLEYKGYNRTRMLVSPETSESRPANRTEG